MAIRILTPDEAIWRAQSAVRAYIPEGSRLSDELIADRRREASPSATAPASRSVKN